MKLKEINKEFQPIETSNVLSDDEMKDTLASGCDYCKSGCATGCEKHSVSGAGGPSQPQQSIQ